MRDEYYFRTEGLTVGYDGVPLIKEIEISIRRGEILTLIGPNGAGKTTILKSIIRQLSPIGGMVYLDGRSMQEMSGKEIATRMSVVLTERTKPELMSCEDVVSTGRYPYTGTFGLLSKKDREIVRESMELVHITELADRDFTRISDGQKQRVMLARAICQEPDLIVLDEPTSFLDIKYKLEFLAIIQKLSRTRNLSVIMSLHELDLAGRISDKIVCVRGDKVDRYGTPEEIFTEGYIPELYEMTVGSYDELSGNLELARVMGEAKVLVLSGNGTGTGLFRRLQREGIPFAAGILWENDLDYPSARALASEVISVRAFASISMAEKRRAMELIDQCTGVLCTLPQEKFGQMGEYGRILEELWVYADRQGKIVQR
ncbi:MAG: ABC transporter ATP-binding protein [Fusicatenibacter sp.]|nr:ABC transporter ATP-binding protein [Fusicatenibacter sp.]